MKKQTFNFWRWLAGLLPRKLVFFAALRVVGERINENGIVEVHPAIMQKINHWFEYAFYEKLLHWSTQNLSDDKYPLWRHGRGWLYFNDRCVFSTEWNPGNRHFCMLHLDWGGGDTERNLSLSFGFPFVGFYHFSLEGFLPEWAIDGYYVDSTVRPGTKFKMPIKRQIGLSIHDGTIWFSLWENQMEHRHDQPWWWSFNFNPANFFLGRYKYSDVELSTTPATVELPEGSYPVNVTLFESTWKRQRWPWPRKMVRARVDCGEQGIPSHAGKGENSWDLEDDLTYSLTCPETTVEGAVQRLTASILRGRERHGEPTTLLKQRAEQHV